MPEEISTPVEQAETEQVAPATEEVVQDQGQTEATPPEAGSEGTGTQPSDQPQVTVPEVTKDGKPILDPSQLPENASQADKDYAKQMMRYFSKRTESLAEAQRKAEELDRIKSSQEWNDYQRRVSTPVRQEQPQPAQPDPTISYWKREMEDAMASGDTEKMFVVNQQMIQHGVQNELKQIVPKFQQSFDQLSQVSQKTQNQLIIDEFAKLHPDFYDFKQTGMASKYVDYYESRGKNGYEALESAYNDWKKDMDYFGGKALKSQKQRIIEKKQAVSQVPTVPQETEVVYVNNSREESDMNLKFTVEGSNKIAKIKR